MAKLGFSSIHQLFLQPGCRTMSKTTLGFSCKGTLQEQMGCASRSRMQAALSHGGHGTSVMLQARRLQVKGMGTHTLARSSTNCSIVESIGEVTAAAKTKEYSGSLASSAWLIDRGAEMVEWREDEVEYGAENEKIQLRFEVDSLIDGHVGRFAFLGILLLGVGLACLTNVGDADASTTSHLNSFSDGGLDVDMRSLALGPEGPLLEEFWDNMRRYGLYFLTVVTGGVYQLVKPAVDALKNPVTAILIVVIVTGSIYLVGLTVSAMLGINEYHYDYAT